MEILIPHIEKLLAANDYVIIPGLGGFVTYYRPAQITPKGITPPRYNIGFNSDMCNNDGLLVLELLRAEKISYREANLLIEQEVEKINAHLKSSKVISFGKIGTLRFDKNNTLIFTSADEANFLPINFGQNEVHITERKKTEEKITISIAKKNVFRYAAAALILLSILLVSPKLGDTSQINYAGFNFKPKQIKESSVKEIITEEKILPIEEEILPAVITADYHVVVACFSTIRQAEKYRDGLIKKQYNHTHILPSVKTNRVIIKSFADKEEAVEFLRNIRGKKPIFKDAWLYEQTVEMAGNHF